jgi:fluoride exporter
VGGVGLWVAVGVLGGVGAVLRWAVDARVRRTAGPGARGLPVGILVVNLTGTFVLGALSGAGVGGDALLLAGVALVGSYTTYSTWVVDCVGAWTAGRRGPAVANALVSLVAGLGAVALGRLVGGLA